MRHEYPLKLYSKRVLATNTVALDFKLLGSTCFSFKAGQFVQLLFNDAEGNTLKRSYSIANSPESFEKTGILSIAISLVEGGEASSLFDNLQIGDESLKMVGPFGVLILPESEKISGKRLILIGTGTGIAPYCAMLPELERLGNIDTTVHILMGSRSLNELIFETEFSKVVSRCQHMEYSVCFSREKLLNLPLEQKKEYYYEGYVQSRLLDLSLSLEKDIIYLCGNPSMIDETFAYLKNIGLSSKQIKREKYVYSGH